MLALIRRLFGASIDLKQLLAEDAHIIDVRSVQEFNSGHAKGSVNIPLGQLKSELSALKSSGKTIITCCASGMRSGIAAKQLKSFGVNAVNGGSWRKVQSHIDHL